MTLIAEIAKAERAVSTDGYDMSVGELINIYRDREITIDPEYQRLFRWKIGQKSNLIESLLLGIPIPPIFVYETENRVWELIDGLQRISTILQFVGELSPESTNKSSAPVPLVAGRYLKSLEGVVWDSSHIRPSNGTSTLPESEKIRIKRARISIQILRRTSDAVSKFDLFQRLNSGGSTANRQELRNCLIVMEDRNFLERLRTFSREGLFPTLFRFTDNQLSEQVDVEYVNRAVVLSMSLFQRGFDVEDFFDSKTIELVQLGVINLDEILESLKSALSFLYEGGGERALYQPKAQGALRPPQNTALETIVVGVARNIDAIRRHPNPTAFVADRLSEIWLQPEMSKATSSGVAGRTRLNLSVPFGEKWFNPAA